jgi:hypothetical protein
MDPWRWFIFDSTEYISESRVGLGQDDMFCGHIKRIKLVKIVKSSARSLISRKLPN